MESFISSLKNSILSRNLLELSRDFEFWKYSKCWKYFWKFWKIKIVFQLAGLISCELAWQICPQISGLWPGIFTYSIYTWIIGMDLNLCLTNLQGFGQFPHALGFESSDNYMSSCLLFLFSWRDFKHSFDHGHVSCWWKVWIVTCLGLSWIGSWKNFWTIICLLSWADLGIRSDHLIFAHLAYFFLCYIWLSIFRWT